MHMSDALISPAVGAATWLASAGVTAYAAKRVGGSSERQLPLMGALGAFVFAAQMINFAIPGTGSSGHLSGGILLAVLLGPHAAFLTMASILTVQALFFADGGLLALGCNIFNMGFFPCYIAYHLFFTPGRTDKNLKRSCLLACVAGLQMGALGVVAQTALSGINGLPVHIFLLFMQPIHLAIGLVEGLITAAVALYIAERRPELLGAAAGHDKSPRALLLTVGLAALICAGCLSLFASGQPDGLEWSVQQSSGREELPAPDSGLHALLSGLQNKTAVFPDYDLKETDGRPFAPSFIGIIGAGVSFAAAFLLGKASLFIYRRKNNSQAGA